MRKKLFYYTLAGILFTSVIGTLSHFIYEWSGFNFYAGFFVPVSESTWEHMKMIFFPMLIYCSFENIMLKKYYPCLPCANAAAILTGTFSIPVIFYTYTGILGTNYLPLDILTFFAGVIIGFICGFRLTLKKIGKTHCKWLNAAILLLFICFIVFTLYPPDMGIFKNPA